MMNVLHRLFFVCLAGLALTAQAAVSRPEMPAPDATAAYHHGAVGVGSWNTSVEYKDIVDQQQRRRPVS